MLGDLANTNYWVGMSGPQEDWEAEFNAACAAKGGKPVKGSKANHGVACRGAKMSSWRKDNPYPDTTLKVSDGGPMDEQTASAVSPDPFTETRQPESKIKYPQPLNKKKFVRTCEERGFNVEEFTGNGGKTLVRCRDNTGTAHYKTRSIPKGAPRPPTDPQRETATIQPADPVSLVVDPNATPEQQAWQTQFSQECITKGGKPYAAGARYNGVRCRGANLSKFRRQNKFPKENVAPIAGEDGVWDQAFRAECIRRGGTPRKGNKANHGVACTGVKMKDWRRANPYPDVLQPTIIDDGPIISPPDTDTGDGEGDAPQCNIIVDSDKTPVQQDWQTAFSLACCAKGGNPRPGNNANHGVACTGATMRSWRNQNPWPKKDESEPDVIDSGEQDGDGTPGDEGGPGEEITDDITGGDDVLPDDQTEIVDLDQNGGGWGLPGTWGGGGSPIIPLPGYVGSEGPQIGEGVIGPQSEGPPYDECAYPFDKVNPVVYNDRYGPMAVLYTVCGPQETVEDLYADASFSNEGAMETFFG